jgi:hypothetical protein
VPLEGAGDCRYLAAAGRPIPGVSRLVPVRFRGWQGLRQDPGISYLACGQPLGLAAWTGLGYFRATVTACQRDRWGVQRLIGDMPDFILSDDREDFFPDEGFKSNRYTKSSRKTKSSGSWHWSIPGRSDISRFGERYRADADPVLARPRTPQGCGVRRYTSWGCAANSVDRWPHPGVAGDPRCFRPLAYADARDRRAGGEAVGCEAAGPPGGGCEAPECGARGDGRGVRGRGARGRRALGRAGTAAGLRRGPGAAVPGAQSGPGTAA